MAKTEKITKVKKGLKTPVYINPEATFQSKMSSPARSRSPKRSPKLVSPPLPELNLPGVEVNESYESRSAVLRPSSERYANMDILKKNPKVSIEELAIILGVSKINLPEIDTKIKPIPLPKIESSEVSAVSEPKSKKSPVRKNKSPVRKTCNIMLGDKPIDKSMISTDRATKAKPVYKIEELKEIAKQLSISSVGTKEALVNSILKELEMKGC